MKNFMIIDTHLNLVIVIELSLRIPIATCPNKQLNLQEAGHLKVLQSQNQ